MRSTVLLLLVAVALPASAHEFDVRPAPAWIDSAAAETSFAIAKKNARWGIYDLLRDHHVRAGDGTEWQYFRTVRKVLSPSGVQNASELELDFDPSFERLVIHTSRSSAARCASTPWSPTRSASSKRRTTPISASMTASAPRWRARYAERDLTIVTRHCGACGREQSVYFTAA